MAKIKLDGDGHVVLENGLPVWITDDDQEVSYDAPKLFASVGATRVERDAAHDRVKELEKVVKKFGANEDEWDLALEKIKQAGKQSSTKELDVAKLEEEVTKRLKPYTDAAELEKKTLESKARELETKLRTVLVSSRFMSAKAIADTYLTPDLAEAKFGRHFEVEGEAVIAYRDPNTKKEKVYSKSDPSKVADFDEALSILVAGDPNYKQWRRASNATGGSAVGGEGVVASGDTDLSLSLEERLSRGLAAPGRNK